MKTIERTVSKSNARDITLEQHGAEFPIFFFFYNKNHQFFITKKIKFSFFQINNTIVLTPVHKQRKKGAPTPPTPYPSLVD